MKKLYVGLTATALAASGLACAAGTANATPAPSTWSATFSPSRVVATTDGTLFAIGYDEDAERTEVVRVSAGVASVLDLGDSVDLKDVTTHGDTAYVLGTVGGDETSTPTLWAVDDAGDTETSELPSAANDAQALAISEDGTQLGLVGWSSAAVYDLDTLADTAEADAITSTEEISNVGTAAFNDGVFEFAGTTDGENRLWSLSTADSESPLTSVDLGSEEGGSFPAAIAVGDGVSYVTTVNGDAALYAVEDGDVVATQPIDAGLGVVLSADGTTAFVTGFGQIVSYDIDALGTYGDDRYAPTYAPVVGDDARVSMTATLDRGALTVLERVDGSVPVVDRITAPSAPTQVTATRDETTATLAFTAPSSNGSSAHPTAFTDLITYAVTLHDVTDPSRSDIVTSNWWATSDLTFGYDEPLVAGDAYLITVTATNGLFTSQAATYQLAAYKAPVTVTKPPVSTPVPPVKQVGSVKAAPVKSSAKKLTLTLAGVSTVPGKVKVYDGKKLIGTATVKNGKVQIKLKKKLKKGKHTVTVKYAGSTSVAKFSKSVKLKVK